VREDQIISIARLKEMGGREPVRIDSDVYIRGVVVSDDREGNIYKSIVVEDSTGGIELKIDLEEIFSFPDLGRGRTVTVRCNSLVLGRYGGSPQLGRASQSRSQVDPVEESQIFSHVIPSDGQRYVAPHILESGAFSSRYVNCYVRLAECSSQARSCPEHGEHWRETWIAIW
jgi:hypothetical protein